MTKVIWARLAQTLGDAVTRDGGDFPTVAPRSADQAAAALGIAHENGWKVRIEGRRTWMPADAPADLAMTTDRLDRVTSVAPADLVATVQAGATIRMLSAALGPHRTRLALDPPGSPDRSLGSILATGTAGPLRHRFRPVRDQILGTTVATGDGRLVRAGGIVVKNVAGYDLSKVQIGGFGAFGFITDVNVRLWSVPQSRRVLVAAGPLDPIFNAARELVAGNVDASLIEMLSPALTGATDWRLLVELAGTEQAVGVETDRARSLVPGIELAEVEPRVFDGAFAEAFVTGPVTFRAGVLPPSLPEVVDLTTETAGVGRISLSPGPGGLRWNGSVGIGPLRRLRAQLAEREIPLTLERAPWAIRRAVGHFGAFREGVATLAGRVRSVFDPGQNLVSPLDGTHDG